MTMASGQNGSTAANEDIVVMDPLAAALQEAETLMESLAAGTGTDTTSTDVLGSGSFAIDSDDEDDDDLGLNEHIHTTTTTATTISNTMKTAVAASSSGGVAATDPSAAAPWHPLHEDFLNASSTPNSASQTQSSAPTTTTTPHSFFPTTSHATTRMRMMMQSNSSPPVTTSTPATTLASSEFAGTSTTATTMDGSTLFFNKASVTGSRLASNLAHMAQRAATQVQTAVGSSTSTSAVTSTTSAYLAHQQQPLSFPILAPVSPLPQQQQQIQQQPPPAPPSPSTTTELDAEAKQALIQTYVGNLIPGERIIMFLTNLLHVSDSSGFQSSSSSSSSSAISNSNNNAGWCCVMTYYRLILFALAPPPPPTRPRDWNAVAWPVESSPTVLQMPLASMDRVEKSVFTVTTATTTSNKTNNSSHSNSSMIHNSSNHNTGNTNGAAGMMMMVLGNNSSNMTPSTTGGNNITSVITTTSQQHMGVVVSSKLPYGRHIRFSTANYQDTTRAYEALQTYAFPGRRNLGYLFAFESKRDKVMASIQTDAVTGQSTVTLEPCPKRFDALTEFQRQFVNAKHCVASVSADIVDASSGESSLSASTSPEQPQEPNNPWSIWTTTNNSYQLCLSYPSILAGPASLDERLHPDAARIVRQCSAFRSEGRLPALTWCGPGGASIWRCSQPKVGLQGNRSTADELFFQHIAERAAAANALVGGRPELPPPSVLVQLTGTTDLTPWMPTYNNNNNYPAPLKILDLRPRSAAMANRTGGYGYENTSNYNGCSLQFCNITNIHGVRDSYQKLSALCLSATASDLTFATAVEDTKWLAHIRLLWSAAWETCYWTHVHRIPVVLHCSHGWDRTSQVAALAQLLLDAHYRTKAGFACLCEKEFMSFGHPFHTRCGHGEGKASNSVGGVTSSSSTTTLTTTQPALDEGQISPIFLQFLDCVFQIVRQYPDCFEFNTHYLYCISEHIYSCRFGNFLCDTERERELVAGLRQRTHSVWDYLEQQQQPQDDGDTNIGSTTTNPHYKDSGGVLLVPLPSLLRQITLWTERHCKHGAKVTTPWTWQQQQPPLPPSTTTSPKTTATTTAERDNEAATSVDHPTVETVSKNDKGTADTTYNNN